MQSNSGSSGANHGTSNSGSSGVNHGAIKEVKVRRFDESFAKYDCVLVFEDGYQYEALLARDDIVQLQREICSRIGIDDERDTLRKFSPLPKTAASDFNNRIQHVARDAYQRTGGGGAGNNGGVMTHNVQQGKVMMSLQDYAKANPQRTRLLNGKLFTPELIRQTQRGGVPEALQ